jgi:hypothetical protein
VNRLSSLQTSHRLVGVDKPRRRTGEVDKVPDAVGVVARAKVRQIPAEQEPLAEQRRLQAVLGSHKVGVASVGVCRVVQGGIRVK